MIDLWNKDSFNPAKFASPILIFYFI